MALGASSDTAMVGLQQDSHFVRGVSGLGHSVASLQRAIEQLIHG